MILLSAELVDKQCGAGFSLRGTSVPLHRRAGTCGRRAEAAVKRIDFEVRAGEVFGLLGPNGAGKTTTVEILEGVHPRSGGEVSVLGIDPGAKSKQLKDRIGVCLQSANLPEKIKVGEAIDLFRSQLPARCDAAFSQPRVH